MNSTTQTSYDLDKNRYDTKTEFLFNEITSETKYFLLCVTIVFKSSGTKGNEDKWLNYYKNAVLGKFRRKMASGIRKRSNILIIDDLTQYEYDICSKYKSTNGTSKQVHHIHGFLPIPIQYKDRIVDVNENLKTKLLRDILTMEDVADVLIEKARPGEADSWLSYMTKHKHSSKFSWNK